jgi:hypothetical protein
MQQDLHKTLSEVNTEKMKAEIDNAMKQVDMAKIKAQVDASVASIDWNKIKAEIERVKETDFKKIDEQLKKIQPEMEKSMQDARQSIDKAKKEMTGYKNFIDGLEKDGLINKKENYTIEYKSGELTINGKKQPADVTRKYNDFLNGRKDFTITKDNDDFNIHNN